MTVARWITVGAVALGSSSLWTCVTTSALVVHEDDLCSSTSSAAWALDSAAQFSWSSAGSCALLADWVDEERNYAW